MALKDQKREELLHEWMRCNDAFKRLARRYGKAPSEPPKKEGPDAAELRSGEGPSKGPRG